MKTTSLSRIFTGLLIVIVGVILLFGNLNIAPFSEIIGQWWPLVIVAVGGIMLLNDRRNYLWALLVIAIGITWQLNTLDIVSVSIWSVIWPLLIIAVGISIVGRKGAAERVSKDERNDITAVLSGSEQKNNSDDFRASKVTAILGGVTLDLRSATIKKEATVEITTVCGGVELIVPDTVLVKCTTSNILGGVENKTKRPDEKNPPILNVVGDVVMAGIEIKN